MNDYEKYREAQIADGKLYQDFVVDVAWQAGIAIAQYASKTYQLTIGESRGGVEIKHDKRYAETGNLYIEFAEKKQPRPGPYAPSGIKREDHWLYVIGNYDIVFFFAKNLLRALFASSKYSHKENKTKTSLGFLLPDNDARKYAALILTPNASGKIEQTTAELEQLAKQLHEAVKADPKQMTLFK